MHQQYLARAGQLAIDHMTAGEGGPFGAIIVKDGEVISEGWNRVIGTCDPTAHAEIVAIRRACEKLGTFHLEGAVLYTSCEPCPMCLSAIYWAHIKHVYYANTRADAAHIGFDDQMIYDEIPQPIDQRSLPMEQLLCNVSAESFRLWKDKQDKVPY